MKQQFKPSSDHCCLLHLSGGKGEQIEQGNPGGHYGGGLHLPVS
jgi:hypothetical protein